MPNATFEGKDANAVTKNFAAYSFTEDSATKLLPRHVLSDSSGNAISPATEASLAAINAKLGALEASSAPVLIKGRSDNAYSVAVHLVPSTLTTGTYYLTAVASGTIRIKKLRFGVTFTGTNAASRSIFEITRSLSGTPSGGTSLTSVGKTSSNTSSNLAASHLVSGITFTPSGEVVVANFAVVSQNSMSDVIELDMSDAPLVLASGQVLALKASGSIVSGVGLAVNLSWTED